MRIIWGCLLAFLVRLCRSFAPGSPALRRSRTAMIIMSTPSPGSNNAGGGFSSMSSWLFGPSSDIFAIPPEYARVRDRTEVQIDTPSANSRQITASMVLDTTMENVWSILTDYDNLAVHVPNLVKSQLMPSPNKGGIRLFQEGAQKIVGFTFRASLTMDMTEEPEDLTRALRERNLHFKLAESQMFSAFDGTWKLRTHSRVREYNPVTKVYDFKYKTLLTYSVYVRPRGPVPVGALEWRIREDIPVNLVAVKMAAERRGAAQQQEKTQSQPPQNQLQQQQQQQQKQRQQQFPLQIQRTNLEEADQNDFSDGSEASSLWQAGWGADETLAAYINSPSSGRGPVTKGGTSASTSAITSSSPSASASTSASARATKGQPKSKGGFLGSPPRSSSSSKR